MLLPDLGNPVLLCFDHELSVDLWLINLALQNTQDDAQLIRESFFHSVS